MLCIFADAICMYALRQRQALVDFHKFIQYPIPDKLNPPVQTEHGLHRGVRFYLPTSRFRSRSQAGEVPVLTADMSLPAKRVSTEAIWGAMTRRTRLFIMYFDCKSGRPWKWTERWVA